MDSSTYNESTTDSGDYWAKEDAEAREAEAARYRRAQRILKAQAYMERQRTHKYEPSQMDNMITDACGALETVDGGITHLSYLAFGNPTPPKRNDRSKNVTAEQAQKQQTEKQQTEKQQTKKQLKRAARHLTKQEIEEYELEALQALVEGREPNVPADLKNGKRSVDPPNGFREDETIEREAVLAVKGAVHNDQARDLNELEIEINYYIDMINKYDDMAARKKQDDLVGTRKRQDDLMDAIKDVERRHEEQQLEQFQYRRQNVAHGDEQQIWSYVGEYYTGGSSRPTNPTRAAPSPENMLGRMVPRRETEESRDARVSKMLDALDNRIAKQAAARTQHEQDDKFERALGRRQKRDLYDKSLLLGILEDLHLIENEDQSESSENSQTKEQNLSLTLDELDKKFYEEVEEAAKEDYNDSDSTEANMEDTGIVASQEEADGAIFDNSCLGCGTVEDDPGTINGVPRTVADTTNAIDSQQVVYMNEEGSDASENSSNRKNEERNCQEQQQDPPENNWFPFLSSAPKKREAFIPTEITLEDPPEEVRENPEQGKSQVHVKKGLKIVAVLEGHNEDEQEEVKVGSSKKPIMVQEDPTPEAPGLTGCWAGSQHDLLTSE
ncbi:unnamed protein product [Cylindrotheca closterium]|uniref:Fibrous sheath-interacting protein 1 n=1 Tax=Cylindrotheca closterium TaxID=2856 RepID=A0AAD2CQE8_9STRA|nr:unnamed protein product [Cylindrotheca closterium]